MSRTVATINVEALTLAELAAILAPLATALPDATLNTRDGQLAVTLPERENSPQAATGGESIEPATGREQATAPLKLPVRLDRKRAIWRDSKRRTRARTRVHRASTDVHHLSTVSTARPPMSTQDVHHVHHESGQPQVRAPVDTVDMSTCPPSDDLDLMIDNHHQSEQDPRTVRATLPGLDGPMDETSSPQPDDLTRRRLRTAVPALLARQRLATEKAKGVDIRNPAGWLATVTRNITTREADQLNDAIEAALARWGPATTETHVCELLTRPAATAAPRPRRESAPAPTPPGDPLPLAANLAHLATLRNTIGRRDVA